MAFLFRPDARRLEILRQFIDGADGLRFLWELVEHAFPAIAASERGRYSSLIVALTSFGRDKFPMPPQESSDKSDSRRPKKRPSDAQVPEIVDIGKLESFLKKCAVFALKFDSLFPTQLDVDAVSSGALPDGDEITTLLEENMARVSWSKAQVLCILCCAFFSLFPRTSDNCVTRERPDLPSINYDEMYFGSMHSSVEAEKLRMHLEYFYVMLVERADDELQSGSKRIVVLRCHSSYHDVYSVMENRKDEALIPFCMHNLGESIDDQRNMLRVDFANAMLGGASLAYGCVQEEITFSLCPELNAARLIHTIMKENEAIVICGAEQFSELEPGTYAFSMRFQGPTAPTRRQRGGAVLAIDAIDYRYQGKHTQYSPESIMRELLKCYAAFSAPLFPKEAEDARPPEGMGCIATGNWGCGVFGGDYHLKFLIQWLACSLAGKQMHYFPFNEREAVQRKAELSEGRVTVGSIVNFLMRLQSILTKSKLNVWDLFIRVCIQAPQQHQASHDASGARVASEEPVDRAE